MRVQSLLLLLHLLVLLSSFLGLRVVDYYLHHIVLDVALLFRFLWTVLFVALGDVGFTMSQDV